VARSDEMGLKFQQQSSISNPSGEMLPKSIGGNNNKEQEHALRL
jgi:hypothetical protein